MHATKTHLKIIKSLIPEYLLLAHELTQISAARLSFAPSHTTTVSSPIEEKIIRKQAREKILEPLTSIAYDWGYAQREGEPIAWLIDNADRIIKTRGQIDPTHAKIIHEIMEKIARTVNKTDTRELATNAAQRIALYMKLTGRNYCSRATACALFGITPANLRKKIQRKQIKETASGIQLLQHAEHTKKLRKNLSQNII